MSVRGKCSLVSFTLGRWPGNEFSCTFTVKHRGGASRNARYYFLERGVLQKIREVLDIQKVGWVGEGMLNCQGSRKNNLFKAVIWGMIVQHSVSTLGIKRVEIASL